MLQGIASLSRNMLRESQVLIRWLLRGLSILLFILQGEIPVAVVNSEVFGNIYITRGIFRVHARSSPFVSQTSMNTLTPWKQCYSHYRLVGQVMGKMEQVKRFCMIGLAGGGFLHTARKLHPESALEAVDLDPVMPLLARRYFNIPEDASLVVADALEYLQVSEKNYDLIYVDVSGGMYPPGHLMGQDFVQLLASSLAPAGVVCMNTVRAHPWDNRHKKMRMVFAGCFLNASEYVSLSGRALPFLPHNVVMLGSDFRDVAALAGVRPLVADL